MRRRRRRGGAFRGPALSPRTNLMMLAGAAVALVVGFIYLVNVADSVDPQRKEVRSELPDAFKN